jgi:sarcosine oxidase subunit gamma
MTSLLKLTDVSQRERFGCKGPQAARWLTERGLPPPATPNTWVLSPDGALIARLGTGEFLVEAWNGDVERVHTSAIEMMSLDTVGAGIYWVPRGDRVLSLSGMAARALLLECCSFNFSALRVASNEAEAPLIVTSMAGVAVTIAPERAPWPRFTIWCDPSFGAYLSSTLLELINDSSTRPTLRGTS